MKKRVWLVAAVLAVPVVVGGVAIVFDHGRASVRITAGIDGDEMTGESETLLAAPESTTSSGRAAATVEPPRAAELEIHVVEGHGEPIEGADVVVYRGSELLRAGCTDGRGLVHLLPFSGAGSVRVELDSQEITRQDLAGGHGRAEIVVPAGASVEATALVDGRPRGGIRFELVNGWGETGSSGFIGATLEALGMGQPSSPREEETDSDGVVRFPYLRSDWSGALRLPDSDQYRFAGGSGTLALERPAKSLVLELEERLRVPTISGRVVFGGQPVPRARWRAMLRCTAGSSALTNECDAVGRFLIEAPDEEMESAQLEFLEPGVGRRALELRTKASLGDLGDVELEPVRTIRLTVQTVSGEAIEGARALLPNSTDLVRENPYFYRNDPHLNLFFASSPTDTDGRAELRCLPLGDQEIRVGAPGYETTSLSISGGAPRALTVVLQRCSAADVTVRDSQGEVSPGLRVVITAPESPFTWKESFHPNGEELALGAREMLDVTYSLPFEVDCPLDSNGSLRLDSVRAGTKFDLWIVDACGKELAGSRGLVLEPGEWRSLAFEVTQKRRLLVVHVRDAFGNPISNVRLHVSRQGNGSNEAIFGTLLVSDRAGMAHAPNLYADDVMLLLERRGFLPRWIVHVPVPSDGATVDVRLAHDWWPW